MHKVRGTAAYLGSRGANLAGTLRFLPLAAVLAILVQTLIAVTPPFVPVSAEARAARDGDSAASLPVRGELMSVSLLPTLAQEPGEAQPSPALEFVRQMTALDVLFILLWIGAVLLGLATGVIRQLILIISLMIGALVGAVLAGPTSAWTGPFTGTTRDAALPATYAVLVIIFIGLIYAFSTRIYPETRLGQYFVIDRFGGAILGFVTGLVAIAILVGMLAVLTSHEWMFLEGTRTNMRAQLTTTPFLPLIATTFPLVTQTIAGTLPVPIKDICERCL